MDIGLGASQGFLIRDDPTMNDLFKVFAVKNPYDFTTIRQFDELAKDMLWNAIDAPLDHLILANPQKTRHHMLYELIGVADEAIAGVMDDGLAKNCMVYLSLPGDYASWVRVGEGLANRPFCYQSAALQKHYGMYEKLKAAGKRAHGTQQDYVELIMADGGSICWLCLVPDITKKQAKAAETALLTEFGRAKDDGLFVNKGN
jgi:hypothetical protein